MSLLRRDTPNDTETRHIPCISCGYDLFGLPGQGNCPECGSLITDTTLGDMALNTDPRWLRRSAKAVATLAISFPLIVPIAIIAVVAGMYDLVLCATTMALWGAAPSLACIALSLPEQRVSDIPAPGSARRLLLALLAGIGVAFVLLMPLTIRANEDVETIVIVLIASLVLLVFVQLLIAADYLCAVAPRIPAPRERRIMRRWQLFNTIFLVLPLATSLIAVLAINAETLFCLICPLFGITWFSMLWGFSAFVGFCDALVDAAVRGERWRSEA